MLPGPHHALHHLRRSLPARGAARPLAGLALAGCLAPAQVLAQDGAQDRAKDGARQGAGLPILGSAGSQRRENGAAEALAGREIGFEADELQYDQETDTITAAGDVLLISDEQSVRADAIIWNRRTGQITASGAVRLVDENGNQLFSDEVVLTEELQAGAMRNLLLAFRQGARLAANAARRSEDGDVELDQAVFSSCPVVSAEGCPRSPSWRVTAERVIYDAKSGEVRFRNAHLELFGARLVPLPGLRVQADGSAISGFFVPNIGFNPSNGVELSQSYYWRIADNRDLTTTAFVYSGAAPMVSAQYRHLTSAGAYQVTGFLTQGNRIPLGGAPDLAGTQALRGYFAGNGRFQIDQHTSVSGSLRLASDRTFLRRYDITREDRIRSTLALERIGERSYFSIAGWATQALLISQEQGQVPLALPLIDYRQRLADPVLGGTIELQGNTLAITRAEGQNTRRAFARARWDIRRITPWGQEVSVTAFGRGDVYHSDNNDLTVTPIYRGLEGWQGRAMAVGAVDVKWPLIGALFGGTQVITPRVQMVAAPTIRNLDIPNEDSRAIDLEDSNLFSLNRFPGHDRVEDGVRVTYGADWQLNLPGWRITSTIGQSYRMTERDTLFPDGTGLSEDFSDFVGRTEVRFREFIKFTHRYRLDKDDLTIRRNEIDAAIGSERNYIEVGYLRLDRDIDPSFEDLRDREEVRTAGRIAFASYWSVFGSAVVNLTDTSNDLTLDPALRSQGFQPLRTRLGVAYADECLEMGFTWRHDYIALADALSGSSFRIYFSLRNLNLR